MKKILITGITGMVGSHLADYLFLNTKWKIYGACRWRSPTDNISHLVQEINSKKRIFLEYMDLMMFKPGDDFVFGLGLLFSLIYISFLNLRIA